MKKTYDRYRSRGKHTTLIDCAEKVVKFLMKKGFDVRFGFIRMNIGTSQQRIKFILSDSGLIMKIRGSNSIQEFSIYGNKLRKAEKLVRQNFKNVFQFSTENRIDNQKT